MSVYRDEKAQKLADEQYWRASDAQKISILRSLKEDPDFDSKKPELKEAINRMLEPR